MRSYRPRRYRSHRPMRLGLWLPITVPYKYAGHRHRPCSNRLISPPRRAYSSKPSARCCSGRQLLGQTDRRTDTVPLLNRAAYYASSVNNVKYFILTCLAPLLQFHTAQTDATRLLKFVASVGWWELSQHAVCLNLEILHFFKLQKDAIAYSRV